MTEREIPRQRRDTPVETTVRIDRRHASQGFHARRERVGLAGATR